MQGSLSFRMANLVIVLFRYIFFEFKFISFLKEKTGVKMFLNKWRTVWLQCLCRNNVEIRTFSAWKIVSCNFSYSYGFWCTIVKITLHLLFTSGNSFKLNFVTYLENLLKSFWNVSFCIELPLSQKDSYSLSP